MQGEATRTQLFTIGLVQLPRERPATGGNYEREGVGRDGGFVPPSRFRARASLATGPDTR
jgi:hypothetical protein